MVAMATRDDRRTPWFSSAITGSTATDILLPSPLGSFQDTFPIENVSNPNPATTLWEAQATGRGHYAKWVTRPFSLIDDVDFTQTVKIHQRESQIWFLQNHEINNNY